MTKKMAVYIGFFGILISLFLLGVFWGTDAWRVKLPVISNVKPFSFLTQNGDSITNIDVEGKVYLASYFFTTCKGICPRLNDNVAKVYKDFAQEPNFLVLSHTCQPEIDSLPLLKKYADSIGAQKGKWFFLTGDKLTLYNTARESYHIDDPRNNVGSIEDQFLHSQFIALVDKSGSVRGVYDGLKNEDIEKLEKDIPALLKEKSKSNTSLHSLFNNNPQ
jgi:protein SCO1